MTEAKPDNLSFSRVVKEKEAKAEALHAKTFTAWSNHQLARHKYEKIHDITHDLRDGVHFIHLLESIYGKKVETKYNANPSSEIHRNENITIALEFLKKQDMSIQVGSNDIEQGNRKLTLGLVWRLIMGHQMLKAEDSEKSVSQRNKNAKSNLIAFCKQQTEGYQGVSVNDLQESFWDGLAFCAMIDHMKPGSFSNWNEIVQMDTKARLKLAFEAAEAKLGIPQLLDPEDMANPNESLRPDEKCIMTYVSEFPIALMGQQAEAHQIKQTELEDALSKERELQKQRELERQKEKEEQERKMREKQEEADKLRDENTKLKEAKESAQKASLAKKDEVVSNNNIIREENKRLQEEIERLKKEISGLNSDLENTKNKLIGKLKVVVRAARGLPAMDALGKSDPYLKLRLGDQEFKTKTKKRTLTPSWEEEFELYVTDRRSEILVTVWDWDRFTKDDMIGHFEIPIGDMQDGHNETKWYNLLGSSNEAIPGEVLLTLSFTLGK